MKVAKRAAQRICQAERVLIASHVSPDGDAIGSILGLGFALQGQGKHVVLVCADPVPEDCRHLPGWQAISSPQVYTRLKRGADSTPPFDLVISLDCSDLARLGASYDPALFHGIPIVNIDHHTTNIGFGEVNWVEPGAAATAQILVHLLQVMHVPLTRDIATCLLNGLLTDTLGFRTPNTDPPVMETAIQLMNAGASLSQLTDRVFNHRPMYTIQMWAAAMQDLHLEGHILWTEITQAMRQSTGYWEDGDAGLVNLLNTANEADIAVVFDELSDGRVNVSMRAGPGYDVSQVASILGGGGHPQAAGCTLDGPSESARARVLELLYRAWEEQNVNR